MRTFAVANQKGGCGKTTISINLSAALAQEGQRVLLVDMDPQGHCALGLAVPEEQIEREVADVLLQDEDSGNVEIEQAIWKISAGLDLLPSTLGLVRFETLVANAQHRDLYLKLALESVCESYDYCVVDCPPHVGLLTYNALRSADEVIIPVDTGYFSMQGLQKAVDTMKDLNARTGQGLKIRVLANCYDVRTKLAREILNEMRRKHDAYMLTSYINFNSKLKEGASFGQSVNEYDPSSMGCRDFKRLAREIIELEDADPRKAVLLNHAERLSVGAEQLLASRAKLIRPAGFDGGSSNGTPDSPMTPVRPPEAPATPVRRPAASVLSAATALDSPESTLRHPASTGSVSIPDAGRSSTPVFTPRPAPLPASRPAPEQVVEARVAEPRAAAPAPRPDHERIASRIDQIYGVRQTDAGIEFNTRVPGANEVLLAGDFNNWSPRDCPMARQETLGHFRATLKLPSGRYRYRLVVDGRWQKDPCNEHIEVNEFGEQNSIVEIS